MHDLVRYNSVTFGKFGKQRQGAKEQLKLHPNCELCLQQINRAKGTSKKHTTVEGFRQHLEGQDSDVQLAGLHRSCRRHNLSFTCRLFVACVASVSEGCPILTNSGLKCLSTGSLPPFPSLSSLFFPKQRACSQASSIGEYASH